MKDTTRRKTMSGASTSMVSVRMIGVRLASDPIYYPASIGQDGKTVSQKLKFTVFANSRQGGNAGERVDSFEMVVWGKRADALAHTIFKGKELHIEAVPQSFKKRVFNQDGSQRLSADGQPVTVTAVNFKLVDFAYGADPAEHIQQEIDNGRRPPMWNVPWTEDYKVWTQVLQNKKAERVPFQIGMKKLGYAEVRIPAGMTVDMSAYTSEKQVPNQQMYKNQQQNQNSTMYQNQQSPIPPMYQQQQQPNPAMYQNQQQMSMEAILAAMQQLQQNQQKMPVPPKPNNTNKLF
jgi:single-stranded DNA-binding protein